MENNTSQAYIHRGTAEQVLIFRDEREWAQFHNPKDLAISLSLEAAELLEVFQWSGSDTGADGRLEKIKEELADIFIYAISMADACGIEADEIIRAKLQRNAQKYPVDKARGNSRKYTEAEMQP